MPRLLRHWVGGRAVDGGARTAPVYNPATGEQVAEVPLAGREEVDAAVAAARAAFPSWRDTSLSRRAEILFAFRDLVASRAEALARIVVSEHGKVLSDARGEVRRGLDVVEFACGIPQLIKGSFSENVSTDVDTYSIRQPLGVVVGISPFNFPVMVPMWMCPIAIACGNTFILKPSEKDPSASLLIAELWKEAGLPDGVFNVLHGDGETVAALLAHPDVRAVSFVGSTPVARSIYETAARAGKRVQALGGAKNHLVVLPDADLDQAAAAAVSAAFGAAGERCMAVSVLVAVGGIADDLVERVRARMAQIRVGDGMNEPDMGPLITREHRARVAGYLDRGAEEGAVIAVDGRGVRVEGGEHGFFLGPCLLDHVRPGMSVYRDEIFGPVLSVVRVGTLDEAIELVNANPYANGAAVFTRDGAAARRFQHEVEIGMVGVNVPIPVPVASYSFGGWKDSLFGDLHIYGEDGVRFYTRTKVVTSRWPAPAAPHESGFAFPAAK